MKGPPWKCPVCFAPFPCFLHSPLFYLSLYHFILEDDTDMLPFTTSTGATGISVIPVLVGNLESPVVRISHSSERSARHNGYSRYLAPNSNEHFLGILGRLHNDKSTFSPYSLRVSGTFCQNKGKPNLSDALTDFVSDFPGNTEFAEKVEAEALKRFLEQDEGASKTLSRLNDALDSRFVTMPEKTELAKAWSIFSAAYVQAIVNSIDIERNVDSHSSLKVGALSDVHFCNTLGFDGDIRRKNIIKGEVDVPVASVAHMMDLYRQEKYPSFDSNSHAKVIHDSGKPVALVSAKLTRRPISVGGLSQNNMTVHRAVGGAIETLFFLIPSMPVSFCQSASGDQDEQKRLIRELETSMKYSEWDELSKGLFVKAMYDMSFARPEVARDPDHSNPAYSSLCLRVAEWGVRLLTNSIKGHLAKQKSQGTAREEATNTEEFSCPSCHP